MIGYKSDNMIDIREDHLLEKGDLLALLQRDQTTGKNIIWGTDSYSSRGESFSPKRQIRPSLITGIYGKVIQPRAAKSREEQIYRTREKAEVFTPLHVVKKMNDLCDKGPVTKRNWQKYVVEKRLEITCGEAPYISSRYDPVSDFQKVLSLKSRVGFLDKKMRVVSLYCDAHKEWVAWAKIAFQSSYGYEWQGDNLLIARENLLYTFIDFYKDNFNRRPNLKLQQEIAEIISWNIFQMDGLRCVIPMSCKHEKKLIRGNITIFGEESDRVEKNECMGCKYGDIKKHNGKYVKVMDWNEGKTQRFVDITSNN